MDKVLSNYKKAEGINCRLEDGKLVLGAHTSVTRKLFCDPSIKSEDYIYDVLLTSLQKQIDSCIKNREDFDKFKKHIPLTLIENECDDDRLVFALRFFA